MFFRLIFYFLIFFNIIFLSNCNISLERNTNQIKTKEISYIPKAFEQKVFISLKNKTEKKIFSTFQFLGFSPDGKLIEKEQKHKSRWLPWNNQIKALNNGDIAILFNNTIFIYNKTGILKTRKKFKKNIFFFDTDENNSFLFFYMKKKYQSSVKTLPIKVLHLSSNLKLLNSFVIPSDSIYQIYFAEQGKIWGVTYNAGIARKFTMKDLLTYNSTISNRTDFKKRFYNFYINSFSYDVLKSIGPYSSKITYTYTYTISCNTNKYTQFIKYNSTLTNSIGENLGTNNRQTANIFGLDEKNNIYFYSLSGKDINIIKAELSRANIIKFKHIATMENTEDNLNLYYYFPLQNFTLSPDNIIYCLVPDIQSNILKVLKIR